MPIIDVTKQAFPSVPVSGGGGGGQAGAIDQATKILSLADLQNKIATAPLVQREQQAATELKEAEASRIQQTQFKLERDLFIQGMESKIKQQELVHGSIKNAMEMVHVSPDAAMLELQSTLPGSIISVGNDGQVNMALRFGNDVKRFSYNKDRLNDPKENQAFSSELRKEWNRTADSFREQDNAYAKVINALSMGGGVGHMVATYSLAKMMDDGGRVTDGDIATIQTSSNMPTRFKVMYEQLFKGETDSLSEEQIADIRQFATDTYEKSKKALWNSAGFYSDISQRRVGSSRDVLTPVNEITPEMFSSMKPEQYRPSQLDEPVSDDFVKANLDEMFPSAKIIDGKEKPLPAAVINFNANKKTVKPKAIDYSNPKAVGEELDVIMNFGFSSIIPKGE